MPLYKQTNAAHILNSTVLSSGTLEALLLVLGKNRHYLCVSIFLFLFRELKKKRLNSNTGHGSVRGSHRADLISECSLRYVIFYARGLWC